MFTGIIEETGFVRSLRKGRESAEILVAAPTIPPTLKVGDSIAVNGVCLTVVRSGAEEFAADLSAETMARSSLARSVPGRTVNLERSLALGARLGGHFVQGHIDGVGRLASVRKSGDGAISGLQRLDRGGRSEPDPIVAEPLGFRGRCHSPHMGTYESATAQNWGPCEPGNGYSREIFRALFFVGDRSRNRQPYSRIPARTGLLVYGIP
jgi:hypothetical protein